MDDTDCNICCETYNASTRKRVTCPYCDYSSCKTCVRTYLLSTTNDPNCPNCHKGWSQDFVVLQLNRAFYNGQYKKHRKKLLTEREIVKLPEAMHAAENFVMSEELEKRNKEIKESLTEMYKVMSALKREQEENSNTIYNIKHGHYKKDECKKFIMPCPENDCRGFLSTSYKCEICKLYTCPKCHEVIGDRRDNPQHVCKEESLKSAEMIQKETKPCPKCGIRIYKISGCDQMWCTECHVAFSWRSGRIENGIIHNPHFYQWQRDTNGGEAPRVPGDNPCGGMPEWWGFRDKIQRIIREDLFTDRGEATNKVIYKTITNLYENLLLEDDTVDLINRNTTGFSGIMKREDGRYTWRDERKIKHAFISYLTSVYRAMQEIIWEGDNLRRSIERLEDTMEIRILYILKRISKDEMASKIIKRDNQRRKNMELMNIYDLIRTVGIETFQYITTIEVNYSDEASCTHFINETLDKIVKFTQLRNYCNDQMATISVSYNMTVPYYNKAWYKETNKYTLSDIKERKELASKKNLHTDEKETTEELHTFTVEHIYSNADFPSTKKPIHIHTNSETISKMTTKKELYDYLHLKFITLYNEKDLSVTTDVKKPIVFFKDNHWPALTPFTIVSLLSSGLEYIYMNHNNEIVDTDLDANAINWMSFENKITIQWNGSRVDREKLSNEIIAKYVSDISQHEKSRKRYNLRPLSTVNVKIKDEGGEGEGHGEGHGGGEGDGGWITALGECTV